MSHCQAKSPFGYSQCELGDQHWFLWHLDSAGHRWTGNVVNTISNQTWEIINIHHIISAVKVSIKTEYENLGRFLYWMTEREQIRIAKEKFGLPRPWTTDTILNGWRFCNVNREDDRVTRWIANNIIQYHWDSPTLWFNLVIARLINWPPTLFRLGYFHDWDSDRFISTMESLKDKVWTGAYMIPAGPKGVPKARYLTEQTLTPLWKAWTKAQPSPYLCADWASWLGLVQALGPFLVNQIVTDLKRTPVLRDAHDWATFVLAGPGTLRGLNRLHGLPLSKKWSQDQAQFHLLKLRAQILDVAPQWADVLRDLNNLANCLCEFDKYMRVLLGEGKPRARYIPATDKELW